MLRQSLRSGIRRLANLPVIGRCVRIAVAAYRLPELRARMLSGSAGDGTARALFEQEQLPTLLDTLSRLNHRQLAIETAQDNLIKSVPVVLRRLTRGHADAEARIGEIDATVRAVGAATEQATTGSAKELARQAESLAYLVNRIEFVRRELMFEMRYGASRRHHGTDQSDTVARIVDEARVRKARAQGALRLNLGCGHITPAEYINVDRRELPGVDVVADADRLPFDPNELDEIRSAHMLEHFPQEQLIRELLPYWRSLLKPGGRFTAIVPDAEAMMNRYAAGDLPYDDLREVMYGSQDYDGDFHFNMFTPDALSALLVDAGFEDVEVPHSGRKNGSCYEFEIVARRPVTADAPAATA